MATTRLQAPNGTYTALNTGPCYIEGMEPGTWRITINTSTPIAGYAAYHLIKYPGGSFTYGGSETVYAQAESSDWTSAYLAVTPVV